MLETTRTLILLICITAFTIYVIHYLSLHADYRNGLLHKAGNLLLYGYLKACINITSATGAFHEKMKSIFTGYPFGAHTQTTLHQKKQHIQHLKTQITNSQSTYNKTHYNLKILK